MEPYKDINKPEGRWKWQQPHRDDDISNTIDSHSKLQNRYRLRSCIVFLFLFLFHKQGNSARTPADSDIGTLDRMKFHPS